MDRRSLMKSALLALAAGPLTPATPWPISGASARDSTTRWRHGLSKLSDLKYPSGFGQFDYVNAKAPKGGAASLITLGSFDNFNIIVGGAKGSLVGGIEFIYDTLMVSALDEVASAYGLLAEAVTYPDDFSSATYRLRADAKWHDGKPVTPEDVIFSFDAVKKFSPQAAASYRQITKAEKTGERDVTFHFDQGGNRVGDSSAVNPAASAAGSNAVSRVSGCRRSKVIDSTASSRRMPSSAAYQVSSGALAASNGS